jgi:hypothetical protein
MNKKTRVLVLAVVALALSATLAACDEASDTLAPETEQQAILRAMEAAIQDEFKAELTYEKVIEDFGSVRPFSNIINAEVRHSEALARLYLARGIPVPESRWSPEEIPGFSSLPEACSAGVVAEIENGEIYEEFMRLDLPADVRMVFENNQRASLQNHLPAFQRCS